MVKTSKSLTKRHTPYAENAPFYFDLACGKQAPGQLLKRIDVHLSGTITFAAGTTSGTSTGENPGGFISRIEVDADPKAGGAYKGGKVVNLTPRAIIRHRIFDEGSLLFDLLLGSTGVAGAATSYVMDTVLPIYFSNPLNANPDDTALRLDQFDNVRVSITTATIVTVLVGNDRTITLSGVYMDIVEYREFAPDFWPVATLYQDSRLVNITGGANAEFGIDSQLPEGDAYLSILLIANTTSAALSDAIINKVTLYTGSEQFRLLYENHIKGEQESYIRDQAAVRTGLYFLPIADGGRIANAMLNVTAKCDISNPGTDAITVVSRRIQPRMKAAA